MEMMNHLMAEKLTKILKTAKWQVTSKKKFLTFKFEELVTNQKHEHYASRE